MIIDAILKINPNAKVSVKGNDIDTCEIVWHDNTTPISKEDIQAQLPIVEAELQQANADKETKKASAKSKLLALGLTEEEIKLTFGI